MHCPFYEIVNHAPVLLVTGAAKSYMATSVCSARYANTTVHKNSNVTRRDHELVAPTLSILGSTNLQKPTTTYPPTSTGVPPHVNNGLNNLRPAWALLWVYC